MTLRGLSLWSWWLALAVVFGCIASVAQPAQAQSVLDGWWTVTSYTCPPYCGRTASGAQVGYGSIAAPSSVPFGTPVLVDGWYVGTVQDRGAFGSRTLDIWLPSYGQAMTWGRRRVWATFGGPAVPVYEQPVYEPITEGDQAP